MRTVKIFSTTTGIQEVTTSSNTWGPFKQELLSKGIITNDMKVVIKEMGTSFESDNAELPQGQGKNDEGIVTHDFTLFLSPTKTKSGYGK